MDRCLELLDVEETTRRAYESNIKTHIRPLPGSLPLTRLNGEVLDAFYRGAVAFDELPGRGCLRLGLREGKITAGQVR